MILHQLTYFLERNRQLQLLMFDRRMKFRKSDSNIDKKNYF